MYAAATTQTTTLEIEQFLFQEARLLDEARFEEWMSLFTEDGIYWAPSSPTQVDPHTCVSLIYDDHEIMAQRIQRLRHPRAYAQIPASRALRQVTNVTVTESDSEYLVRSTLFMYEYRATLPEPTQRIFAADVHHRLKKGDAQLQISFKKVVLVNCDATFTPIFLYF